MEGSTNNKNVENYKILSRYYDKLLQDEEALSLWLKYIEEEPFYSVLELASGSGVMANLLTSKGYDVIASDISKDMKNSSKSNYDGKYIILNMIDYNLDKKFDLILCIVDSINYLYEDELDRFFDCAYKHLNDNGRIIFDMHSLERLKEFKDEYIEEGYIDSIPYQWSILSDEIDNTILQHFTFYTKDGMIQEHHQQFVYSSEFIKEKMKSRFDVKVIDDFIEEEKVLIVGYKK